MANFLTKLVGERQAKKAQRTKDRILKNKEAVLDVMAENIKGARQCPFLLGQKCIGALCEHFQKYTSFNQEGKRFDYYRCVHVQIPRLQIELLDTIRGFNNLMLNMLKEKEEKSKIIS